MQPGLSPIVVLCLLGVGQALVLACVLLTIRRGNLIANRLLAALAVTISIVVTAPILSSSGYFLIYPHLTRLNHPFDLVGGPLLFLYIRALVTKTKLKRKDLLHFIPAVLVAVFLIPYYLQSREYKVAHLTATTWYYTRCSSDLRVTGRRVQYCEKSYRNLNDTLEPNLHRL